MSGHSLRKRIEELRSAAFAVGRTKAATQEMVTKATGRLEAFDEVLAILGEPLAVAWGDDAAVEVLIQVRVDEARTAPSVISQARRLAQRMIATGEVGTKEEQWCSASMRVRVLRNPVDETWEQAPKAGGG